jgi:23S rRNA pseudouridine1911/1915/1917 synthase
VDVVLARRAGVPRSAAQQALKKGEVTVDGAVARPSQRLDPGQLIEGELAVAQVELPEAEDIALDLRYSDERLLVVSKPAGLVTHPGSGNQTGTLVNALLGLGIPLGGRDTARPGIVHRLDKDTSGLLLVARDDEALEHLSTALKNRDIQRRYLALVRGHVQSASGTIEAPIGRHPVARRKMAVTSGGRVAVTHYTVLQKGAGVTLIEARLETGRTHQIRVHLAHLKHPVLGDPIYGGRSELAAGLGLKRPFLHAWKLAFPHPDDGRLIEVSDALPPDLKGALEAAELTEPEPES